MKLNKGEAYICKNNKVKYVVNDDNRPCVILNPLKGSYKELRDKIMDIISSNNILLGIKFNNLNTYYLTVGRIDPVTNEKIISYTDNCKYIKYVRHDEVSLPEISNWADYEKNIEDCDVNVYHVIHKGLLPD